jgi:hypothetical protein
LLAPASRTAVDLPESVEALVEEARKKQYDMPTLLIQLKAMVCANCQLPSFFPHSTLSCLYLVTSWIHKIMQF